MHIFPVETARLRTRPIAAADEPLFTQLYTDQETMRFIGAPLSAERAAVSFRKVLAGMERSPIQRLFLTVSEKQSLRDVGIFSLQNCDPQRRSIEAGVMFIPPARALGYSKEIFIALIPRVFVELPVDELSVQFAAEHVAVQRSAITIGFTRRGEAGLEAGARQRSVWSVRRDTWVAPDQTRIPDDISDGKQA
jgi:RimJ/RimL family protein N-acetyltransferase